MGHRVIIIPDPQSQTHVTVVALEVETALCDVAAAMEREAEVVSRQREGERKRKVLNKGAAVRDKELEGKAEEVRKRRTKLAEFLKEFVDGWVANPFIHCFNTHTESRHDLRDLRAPLDNGYDMYSWPQTPEAGTGKSSGQRQKGQTITKTEMMRRRRLLGSIATFQVRVYLCMGRAPLPFNHHRYSLYATYVRTYSTT